MHELSIARNILEIVSDELLARKIDQNVEKIVFKVNRINAVFPDSLRFLFDTLKEEYEFCKNSFLEIIIDPYISVCINCGLEHKTDEIEQICMKCGGILKLLPGDEMKIESFSTFE